MLELPVPNILRKFLTGSAGLSQRQTRNITSQWTGLEGGGWGVEDDGYQVTFSFCDV